MKNRLNTTFVSITLLLFSINGFANDNTDKTSVKAHSSPHSAMKQPSEKTAEQLAQDKKVAEAIAKYKKIIKENPENKKAYRHLADVYLLNNKAKEAIPAYQEAILHDAKNPKLFAAMSIAYLHLGKYAMAKAMANEAVILDPSMENAKKIISYTDKKVKVLELAAKTNQAKMPTHDAEFLKKGTTTSEKPAAAALAK
ncbi:MAG: tetratricopeptide repeat protein [Cocleimonas sp.]|nr:tetratricopeptide repeat protein [Cocleimonas sp.]